MARQPNVHDSRYGASAIISVIMAFVGWGMLVLTEASQYIENVGTLLVARWIFQRGYSLLARLLDGWTDDYG